MATRVLFADDQIPWEKDADNEKVRQEIVKELGSKLPNVSDLYEKDKQWFAELIDSLKTQGLELILARTFSEAERKIRQTSDYDVAIIDLSWNGDRRLKSSEKKGAGLKLIDEVAKQNENSKRYTPVIALSQNYKDEPLLVATVLEKAALPVQKVYDKDKVGHRTLAAAVKLLAKLRPAVPSETSPGVLATSAEKEPADFQSAVQSTGTLPGKRVFIGHGHSALWRELKDFIADRLGLPWDEFNREAVAGYPTSERLQTMMSHAAIAFLVMTAEEERADATLHARSNVIHEVGLFQGCLGLHRAIVLLEEGCSEFSNIIGLSHISFPRGDIAARFDEIRRVLEREKLV